MRGALNRGHLTIFMRGSLLHGPAAFGDRQAHGCAAVPPEGIIMMNMIILKLTTMIMIMLIIMIRMIVIIGIGEGARRPELSGALVPLP